MYMSVCCNCELTCWFWPSRLEQWRTKSSSPQSETEGGGGRGGGRLWWIRREPTDKTNASLLTKTNTRIQKHTQRGIRSSMWLSLPPETGHQSPPTCLSLWALKHRNTHAHTHTHKHTNIHYLQPRDGGVVECWGLQRQSDFFAVVHNLIQDRLDLLSPFLQHRKARQIWEQLCLVSRPPQNTKKLS